MLDPSAFDDPLALETSWSPAASGGASFGTHRLRSAGSHRVEFVATAAWKLFYLLFLFAGLGVTGWHLGRFGPSEIVLGDPETFVPLVVGLIFVGAGAGMGWVGSTPRVFDKGRAMYWRGRQEPAIVGTHAPDGACAPLASIHALQLVSEHVRSEKNSYTSYELNLVLADASRINVVDHGDLEQLRADAHTLGAFLGKPVWDAIG